ncbi:MAG: PDZ domain-containing protein [Gammaproteobacteria bacterium]|nr:PDZ domain-containing protein [Gammaproteobacteria bacterium]
MTRKILSAALLAATLTTLGATGTALAGHKMHGDAKAMDWFAAHHGVMPWGGFSAAESDGPRLGVAITGLAQSELDARSLEYGVRIERVAEGSIAAAAGLKPGDIVTALGERPAYSPQRLQHLVGTSTGNTSLTLVRDGEEMQLAVDLAAPVEASGKAALGIRIQDMTADLQEAFGAPAERGVLVAQVNTGSAAAAAGMKAGDVLIAIGDAEIGKVDDVHAALAGHAPGDSLTVKILRDRQPTALSVTLDAAAQQVAAGNALGHGYRGQGMHGHHGYGMRNKGDYGHHGRHAGPGCYKRSMPHRS